MNTILRSVTAEAASEISFILRESITESCSADHGNDPLVIAAWLANKTPANVASWIAAPDSIALGAYRCHKLVGFALVAGSELTLCYIVPEVLYLGVGRALLCEAESQAAKQGISSLHLDATRTAEDFYRRNGYEAFGTSKSWAGLQTQPMRKRVTINSSIE